MNRDAMRTNIETALSTVPGHQFVDSELNRAITEAVTELSRFYPRLVAAEVVLSNTVTAETFTSDDDTAVTLANKPIKWDSEAVSISGTEYERNTDYTMDYINGTITTIGAGSISDGVTVTLSYTKDRVVLDVSSTLTNPISIQAVEYPVGEIPQETAGFLWDGGDFLTLTNLQAGGFAPATSQEQVANAKHLRIWYGQLHTDPTDSANGTYPRFLDELVVRGASGFALRIEAMRVVNQVVRLLRYSQVSASKATNENVAVRTAVGLTSTELALGNAALDKMTAYLATSATAALNKITTELTLAKAALGDIRGSSTFSLTHADTALDKVDALITATTATLDAARGSAGEPFDLADTALDKIAALANGESGSIVSDIEGITAPLIEAKDILLTIKQGDLSDANTALDKVATHAGTEADAAVDKVENLVTAGTDSIDDALDYLNAIIGTDAVTALDNVLDNLETDTRNADKYLDEGDALLNTITVGGPNAPKDYVAFANAKIDIAKTFVQEASMQLHRGDLRVAEAGERFKQVQARLGEAAARINMAGAFNREAELRIGSSNTQVNRARELVNVATTKLQAAQARNFIIEGFISEAAGRMSMMQSLIEEAQQRVGSSQAFVSEANSRIQISQALVGEAGQYVAVAQTYALESQERRGIAEGFAREAAERVRVASGYLGEADRRQAINVSFSNQAESYRALADQHRLIADTLNLEADRRIGEFRNVLRDAAQSAPQRAQSARRQYPSG